MPGFFGTRERLSTATCSSASRSAKPMLPFKNLSPRPIVRRALSCRSRRPPIVPQKEPPNSVGAEGWRLNGFVLSNFNVWRINAGVRHCQTLPSKLRLERFQSAGG